MSVQVGLSIYQCHMSSGKIPSSRLTVKPSRLKLTELTRPPLRNSEIRKGDDANGKFVPDTVFLICKRGPEEICDALCAANRFTLFRFCRFKFEACGHTREKQAHLNTMA
jgi:hypothetical protein